MTYRDIDERDYENYTDLFAIMTSYLTPPHLLIYLRASVPTLVRHIQQRGREYETSIRIEYLQRLNGLYEDWIDHYTFGPKMMVTVSGASHLDWFGPTHAGMGVSGETALAFQKVYLEGDERWKPLLLEQAGGTVVTNIE